MMRLFLAIVLLASSISLVEAPRPGAVAPFGVAPARAAVSQTFFVKLDGSGSACTRSSPCASVQSAVNQAADGDTVYVAGGTHVGTGAAVVSISRGITLAGGWDGEPSGEPVLDPELYPTVLDGEGSRRGVYVGGLAANYPRPRITLKGIVVRRGNATGLGGGMAVAPAGADAGGGIYAKGANLVVERCTVADSTASASGDGTGGGLFAADTDLVVTDSTFRGNTASVTRSGYGGGIGISGGTTVRLARLSVEGNLAGKASRGVGGGAYILGVAAELSDSVIWGNTGSSGTGADRLGGKGGGVALQNGPGARIVRNVIESNAAAESAVGDGGGVFVTSSQNVTLAGNVLQSNVASRRGLGQGGGINVYYSLASLSGNDVSDNAASESGEGEGGALFVFGSDAALRGEEYYANEAVSEPGALGQGAAISARGSDVTATNSVFARNGISGNSDGLFFGDSTVPGGSTLALRFVTLADNGETGLTVATDNGEATLENVIVSGQNVGLHVSVSTARVHADHTLWYPFTSFGGRTERITTSHDVVGDPLFVDRTARDYHLGDGSAAIDAGSGIGESDDFEGDCRPRGGGYDIGADEFRSAEGAPYCTWRLYLPLISSR